MAEWRCYGTDRRMNFEQNLTPKEMAYTIDRYQREFGEEFGVREFLELKKVEAMALIAEAINDAPEFMMDQIGISMNDGTFSPVTNAIESIAEAISETT